MAASHYKRPIRIRPTVLLQPTLDTTEIARETSAVVRECVEALHPELSPLRHQRAIVLLARSPEETKLRLQLEGRMRHGEQVLQVVTVGE